MESYSIWRRIRSRTRKELKRMSIVQDRIFRGIRNYEPVLLETPAKMHNEVTDSAWRGLELIIKDIINRSGCGTDKCLEFGVEFGYSTVVFSNYFNHVTGVDIFIGDVHAGFNGDIYPLVKGKLNAYPNITLIQNDYKDYIRDNNEIFDFIHVDIIHTYEATFACGLWAAEHSKCTIFHDTESFSEVKRAVLDIAKKTKKTFYNYIYSNGLGILY